LAAARPYPRYGAGQRFFGRGDVFHQGQGREYFFDFGGQLGMAVDVFLERGPLALAITLKELFGYLQHDSGV
jgi:hypothetical protein